MEWVIVIGLIVLALMANAYRKDRAQASSRSGSLPKGSIGALSAEIGYDIRDLWMAGQDTAIVRFIASVTARSHYRNCSSSSQKATAIIGIRDGLL